MKENFTWRYDPQYDPTIADATSLSPSALASCGGDDFVCEITKHLPDFQIDTLSWWNHCSSLARSLVRIFALALDLPEDYFDSVTTHPGADGLYLHYPGTPDLEIRGERDVGIGSHTDIQCFTLLWQDMSGGLQVLSNDEWIEAIPVEGAFVVNIGDFLQRLSNNRFKSTMHRVFNFQTAPRYSMPFFFGFNHDSICEVVPTCIDKEHPALYEPISCGEVSYTLSRKMLAYINVTSVVTHSGSRNALALRITRNERISGRVGVKALDQIVSQLGISAARKMLIRCECIVDQAKFQILLHIENRTEEIL